MPMGRLPRPLRFRPARSRLTCDTPLLALRPLRGLRHPTTRLQAAVLAGRSVAERRSPGHGNVNARAVPSRHRRRQTRHRSRANRTRRRRRLRLRSKVQILLPPPPSPPPRPHVAPPARPTGPVQRRSRWPLREVTISTPVELDPRLSRLPRTGEEAVRSTGTGASGPCAPARSRPR